MKDAVLSLAVFLIVTAGLQGGDAPQPGEFGTRNMVSAERGLPESFEPGSRDPKTGEIVGTGPNVRWVRRIGSRAYTAPVVAEGCVFVGTNNDAGYDPEIEGDRGVLLCFEETTGRLLRQIVFPKVDDIRFFDTAQVGLTSPVTVRDGKVYFVSNRGELLCMRLDWFKNERGEKTTLNWETLLRTHFQSRSEETDVPQSRLRWEPPLQSIPGEGVIWLYDMISGLGIRQHDTNNHSVLYHKGLLYVGTANGLDGTHKKMDVPEAAALLVFDAESGRPLGRDDFWVGPWMVHGQWTSPTLGRVDGKDILFFASGNGVLYAFRALDRAMVLPYAEKPTTDFGRALYRIEPDWIFQGDPTARANSGLERAAFHIGSGGATYCAAAAGVFYQDRLYLQFGSDIANSSKPRTSWLVALDPRAAREHWKPLDRKIVPVDLPNVPDDRPIDATDSALAWSFSPIEDGAVAPIAIDEGLVYFADRKGNLRVLDAATGEPYGSVQLNGDPWGGVQSADGKLYVGTDRRHYYILRAGKTPEILADLTMPEAMFAPTTAANETIYIPLNGFLYAVGK